MRLETVGLLADAKQRLPGRTNACRKRAVVAMGKGNYAFEPNHIKNMCKHVQYAVCVCANCETSLTFSRPLDVGSVTLHHLVSV